MLERLVAKPRPQRAIDARGDRPRLAPPRVDRARVRVRPLVRLDAPQDPLGARIDPVEIEVHRHRVHRPRRAHHLRCHQLRAGPVLRLRRQHEARIVLVVDVPVVVVVIDPGRQPRPQPLDERQRRLLERRPAPLAGERHVQHRHPPLDLRRRRQRSRRQERKPRQRGGRGRRHGCQDYSTFAAPPVRRSSPCDVELRRRTSYPQFVGRSPGSNKPPSRAAEKQATYGERGSGEASPISADESSQIAARLRLSPSERLRYLEDMIAFEELARHARRVT